MLKIAALAFFALAAVAGPSAALASQTHEVLMKNRGEKGPMVFEPDYLEIAPGDKVVFVPTHKSHNAATIDGMIPDGAEGFRSRINERFEVVVDAEGFYGIKCTPHYGMGMVMLIKVGAATLPESYKEISHPGRSKGRMEALLEQAEGGSAD